MTLIFSGKVECKDPYRCDEHYEDGSVFIEGKDVVKEIDNSGLEGKKVHVAIASDFLIGDTSFEGMLKVAMGWGYSEYTPVDKDELFVGTHDLIAQLSQLEGKNATLWVADEPLRLFQ